MPNVTATDTNNQLKAKLVTCQKINKSTSEIMQEAGIYAKKLHIPNLKVALSTATETLISFEIYGSIW